MTGSLKRDLEKSLATFVAREVEQASLAFEVFRKTGTLVAHGEAGFVERIPGERKYVSLNHPGPFTREKLVEPAVFGFDGTQFFGDARASVHNRYEKLFERHPDVTTIAYLHSPYLGAWAQTHRSFPIRYLPLQRVLRGRDVQVYVDHRQAEQDFILERLAIDPDTSAILVANGGVTVWGKAGLRRTAELLMLLEDAARLQLLSQAVGGSRDFGPGALAQFTPSVPREQSPLLGLLPPITH
jgi:hypothetical protein